jgi:hypothetical protein
MIAMRYYLMRKAACRMCLQTEWARNNEAPARRRGSQEGETKGAGRSRRYRGVRRWPVGPGRIDGPGSLAARLNVNLAGLASLRIAERNGHAQFAVVVSSVDASQVEVAGQVKGLHK